MAASKVNLPPGFVLEEPQSQAINLPPGFELEQPAAEPVPWYKQTMNAATKSFIPNPKPYEVFDPSIQRVENFASKLPNGLRQGVAALGTFPLHLLNSQVKMTRAIASPLGMMTMGAGAVTGPAGAVLRTGMGAGYGAKGAQDVTQALQEPLTASSAERGLSGAASLLGAVGGLKADAGQVLGKVGAKYAPRMYKSALKPSTAINPAKVARAVDTGLTEGIPVHPEGLADISDLITTLNRKIAAEIGSGQGKTVNKFDITSRLGKSSQRFSNQVNPESDLNAISDAGSEFLRNQPAAIPVADAQRLKQGTYQQLSSKAYGEMKSATIEAQKSLARGIKEELARQFPELNNLNAQEGRLLDLQPLLERAVNRIGNHDLMGIGTPIAAGAIKAVGGSSKAAAVGGILKAVLDNPAVKSRIAISLSRAGKGRVSQAQAAAQVAAYVNALAASSQSSGESPSQ